MLRGHWSQPSLHSEELNEQYEEHSGHLHPPHKRRRLNISRDDDRSTNLSPSPSWTATPDHSRESAILTPQSPSSACSRGSSHERSPDETHGSSEHYAVLREAVCSRAFSSEICFGMLSNIAVETTHEMIGHVRSPITAVSISGRRLTLTENSTFLVGTFDSSVAGLLSTLLAQDGVNVQAYVKQNKSTSKQGPKKHNHGLSVIIYGPPHYAEAVARFLDMCGQYLQDPRHCDRNVRYINPQSLVQNPVMTQEYNTEVLQDIQAFHNPEDVLADLETVEDLPEADTPSSLETDLFAHQKQALTFMQRRERGWAFSGPHDDLWRAIASPDGKLMFANVISDDVTYDQPPDFRGGILADQMGLGKSLSMIALIAGDRDLTLSKPKYHGYSGHVRTTLLVVRAALLHMWEHQLRTHVHPDTLTWKLHHEQARIRDPSQLQSCDIVITTYHTLMAEWKKHQNNPQIMYITYWHRVILDEAHDIRESRSLTSKATCALEANARWALTGTPIQNRLADLSSLFKFLRIYPYDDPKTFSELVSKLCNESDSGVEKLKKMMRYIMLRRSINKVKLPERRDVVSKLQFSDKELALYEQTKSRRLFDDVSGASPTQQPHFNVLAWINRLLMICNLGTSVKQQDSDDLRGTLSSDLKWDDATAQDRYNSLATAGEAICVGCSTDLSAVVTEVADPNPGELCQPLLSKCLRLICGPCLELKEGKALCKHVPACPAATVSTLSSVLNASNMASQTKPTEQWVEHTTPTKIKALLQDLHAYSMKEKSVVFSFWTSTLDHIEATLDRNGFPSVRIDGNVSQRKRNSLLKTFREDENVRVILLTISCGAVGLDLTVASRAYLMEPSWNPSIEQQALARIHRMGQKRPVTTVRYIMRGSIEDHVLKVQNGKHMLANLLLSGDGRTHGSERIQQLRSLL